MPSTSNPIQAWKARERAVLALGTLALALSLAWAVWPLPQAPAVDTTLTVPERDRGDSEMREPLNRTAFAAPIWNPPPPPETTTAQAPSKEPAPPPRLQLIGIVHDTDEAGRTVLRAALYDPDTDTLHLVASGESIGVVRVASINIGAVELDSGGRISRLALHDEGGLP